MMRQVWPNTFVEENNLTQNISALRRALGGNGSAGNYIETIPRVGYRFNGEVREIAEETEIILQRQTKARVLITEVEEVTEDSPQKAEGSFFLTHRLALIPALAGVIVAAGVGGAYLVHWRSVRANHTNPVTTPNATTRSPGSVSHDPLAYEYYLRGDGYLKQGNYKAAAQSFEMAVKLDADYSPAWAGLASAYYGIEPNGYNAKFDAALKRAFELDPNGSLPLLE